MIHQLHHMIGRQSCQTQDSQGRWVRAVPLPFVGGILDRLRDAWTVMRGTAFAAQWPKSGDLEDILEGEAEGQDLYEALELLVEEIKDLAWANDDSIIKNKVDDAFAALARARGKS